jgi:hypothetical protein
MEGIVKVLKKLNLTLIDIVVILSGLVLLFVMGLGNLGDPIKAVLEAIGTSLIAAGFVTYLMRRFYFEEQRDTIKVFSERRCLENEFLGRKFSAREIDVVALALSGGLQFFAGDPGQKLLKRILLDGVKVRLMFLSPSADYVRQRALEDGTSMEELQGILKRSVIQCVTIYKNFRNLYKNTTRSGALNREKIGSFEIRMIDMCPYCTIYRTDDIILWGIYTSRTMGLNSAALEVPKGQGVLFDQLSGHFDSLWNTNLSGESGENYLVKFYDPNVPTLRINEKLVEQTLGQDWKKQCGIKEEGTP